MLKEIKNKLLKAMPGAEITITDQSQKHLDHVTSGMHLSMEVIYSGFEGKTLIEQHQMVYNILREELKEKIHALQLKTKWKKN